MWYSKHHYAAVLAKDHEVYFVSPPDKWRWKDLFSTQVKITLTPENVRLVEYRNNLPLRFLPKPLTKLINRFNSYKISRIHTQGDIIHWCFHPSSLVRVATPQKPNSRIIYHVVDPFQSDPNDTPFAKRSDLVIAINKWYLSYYQKLNDNCILIPHGIRKEDRSNDPLRVSEFKKAYGAYAVMAAGINYRTNYALLLKLVDQLPTLNLVLVGQLFNLKGEETLRDELFAKSNVTYAGIMHPNDLRNLIAGASVGLVTYNFEVTRSVPVDAVGTPLKVITYLAQNCPVVSTINSYVPTLDNNGAFKAENSEHFVTLVDEVLRGSLKIEPFVVNSYLDSVEYSVLIYQILSKLNLEGSSKEKQRRNSTDPETDNSISLRADIRPRIPEHSPILIISNEAWTGPIYSKHRYALALNKFRKIYFIDPPDHWRPSHLLRLSIKKRITPEGINILSYRNAIPLLGGALGPLNDWIISRRIRNYLHRHSEQDSVFWSFDPSRLTVPHHLGAILSIYHCADDHAFRWKGERVLAKECDHVFCIARDLMPRFKEFNSSVHHVPHGLSESDMAPNTALEHRDPAKPGYGLYIGNINDRHDFILWEKLIKEHPDVTWMIVGPVNVTDRTGLELISGKYPNVVLKTLVTYSTLRVLIANADFGFLYMRRDHPANRISSQKAIQFLAQGKPFFCSWFSEYADHIGLVNMTDDHESALAQFAEWRAHGEPASAKELRLDHARSQQFSRILNNLPFRF